jgi:hypothetical protein
VFGASSLVDTHGLSAMSNWSRALPAVAASSNVSDSVLVVSRRNAGGNPASDRHQATLVRTSEGPPIVRPGYVDYEL